MMTLAEAAEIGSRDKFLAVVSTLRADGTIQSSVVDAGLLPDPQSGQNVVGFVTYGKAKLANLRARPQVAVTFRAGWQWATIEGARVRRRVRRRTSARGHRAGGAPPRCAWPRRCARCGTP
jgi:Pyridoxamine 5'-phosphate oxidase